MKNSIIDNIENGNLKAKDVILYAGLLILLGFIVGKAAAPINMSFGSNNGNTYLCKPEDEKEAKNKK